MHSVLNQSYQDIEVIVLDDCSTDDSREVIELYRSDPRVRRIIFNKENSGRVFDQWHKAIQETSGEYIWIAESDDWCEESFLATVIEGMQEYPNCVLGYCQSYCMLDENRIDWQSAERLLKQRLPGKQFVHDKMLPTNSLFNASMAVWRRSSYQAIGTDYRSFNYCGDWLFWVLIAQLGDVFISGKALNYFRREAGNHSAQSGAGAKSVEELKLFNFLKGEGLIDNEEYDIAISNSYLRFRESSKWVDAETRQHLAESYKLTGTNIFNLDFLFAKRFVFRQVNRMTRFISNHE
jgi:glycosyltransferase involved in cell wall biosynthesis